MAIRVRPKVASVTQPQKAYNARETWKSEQAASGNAARQEAKEVKIKNLSSRLSGNKPPVVKVDSNPVKPGKTQVSSMASKRGPSLLAGGGIGGMFGIKNR